MSDAENETCPSLCVERSHPGREHDPTIDGCYCWELCPMGPTCPGANAGLPRGCYRVTPPGRCSHSDWEEEGDESGGSAIWVCTTCGEASEPTRVIPPGTSAETSGQEDDR